MQTNIQRKVERLNLLYHRIITNYCIEEHQDQFRFLIQQLKSWGYRFKEFVPGIENIQTQLNDQESKLKELLELMTMARKYGEINHLFAFTDSMKSAEYNLIREIIISLCKRKVEGYVYFKIEGTTNTIHFIRSGHWIDAYILL